MVFVIYGSEMIVVLSELHHYIILDHVDITILRSISRCLCEVLY